ncbi:hypothetical protein TSAR_001416 [Trichomalopsis sarcophagae]|uniref:Uncharacterized protein n=1 Tax=Trichomalopsis sarcophagae TaxID=543379 RepID=A0A232EYQ1_9HYME|nr:hypothetical protein TSAR_001416 [Trichomalopsis sarcophagae]
MNSGKTFIFYSSNYFFFAQFFEKHYFVCFFQSSQANDI